MNETKKKALTIMLKAIEEVVQYGNKDVCEDMLYRILDREDYWSFEYIEESHCGSNCLCSHCIENYARDIYGTALHKELTGY